MELVCAALQYVASGSADVRKWWPTENRKSGTDAKELQRRSNRLGDCRTSPLEHKAVDEAEDRFCN